MFKNVNEMTSLFDKESFLEKFVDDPVIGSKKELNRKFMDFIIEKMNSFELDLESEDIQFLLIDSFLSERDNLVSSFIEKEQLSEKLPSGFFYIFTNMFVDELRRSHIRHKPDEMLNTRETITRTTQKGMTYDRDKEKDFEK